MLFQDRFEAGRLLASRLSQFADRNDVIVLRNQRSFEGQVLRKVCREVYNNRVAPRQKPFLWGEEKVVESRTAYHCNKSMPASLIDKVAQVRRFGEH